MILGGDNEEILHLLELLHVYFTMSYPDVNHLLTYATLLAGSEKNVLYLL